MQVTRNGKLQPLLALPQKQMEVVSVPLPNAEAALYKRLQSFTAKRARELGAKEFACQLALLTRLRQLACDPHLLPTSVLNALERADEQAWRRAAAGNEDLLAALRENALDDCAICLDNGADCITKCRHAALTRSRDLEVSVMV